MENLRATRSVSITELKRSPSAVLAEANFEPVAVLNHNKPAAYLLPAATYEAMLDKLEIDFVRNAIQLGKDSGASIPADLVFADLEARYADEAHSKDA